MLERGLMRAARLHKFGDPVKIEQVPIPTNIGSNNVLVRVKVCGICHTDFGILSGQLSPPKLPMIPGHEPAGEIVEVGKFVKEFKAGDRVCVNSVISCGHCHYCIEGQWNLCINPSNLGVDWGGGWG